MDSIFSDIKIYNIIYTSSFNTTINLDLLVTELQLDDNIVGIRYTKSDVYKGIFNKKSKIKKQSKNTSNDLIKLKCNKTIKRKDFSNQVTVALKYNKNNLNIKIFKNGAIVITGGTHDDDGKNVLNIFKKGISTLTKNYKINDIMYDENIFKYGYIQTNNVLLLSLIDMLQLDIDLYKLNLSNILLNDNVNNEITFDDKIQRDNYIKVNNIIFILKCYYKLDELIDILEHDENNDLKNLINDLNDDKICKLPLTFDMKTFNKENIVTIYNYCTKFTFKYGINREKLKSILLNDNIYISVKYNPCVYQGINVKFMSRIYCNKSCNNYPTKNTKRINKCPCKEVSMLIFQNNALITGGHSFEQIKDAYKTLCSTILNNRDIVFITDDPSPKNNKTLLVKTITKDNNVYILKQNILNDPKSCYIIKKHNIYI